MESFANNGEVGHEDDIYQLFLLSPGVGNVIRNWRGMAVLLRDEGINKRSPRIWGECRGTMPPSFHSLSSFWFFVSHLFSDSTMD